MEGSRLNAGVATAEHLFEYNKDVAAFREYEYPMLKGK